MDRAKLVMPNGNDSLSSHLGHRGRITWQIWCSVRPASPGGPWGPPHVRWDILLPQGALLLGRNLERLQSSFGPVSSKKQQFYKGWVKIAEHKTTGESRFYLHGTEKKRLNIEPESELSSHFLHQSKPVATEYNIVSVRNINQGLTFQHLILVRSEKEKLHSVTTLCRKPARPSDWSWRDSIRAGRVNYGGRN